MKTFLKLFSAAIIPALFFISCEKADQEIKKLNRHDGKWKIESIHYENYDSLGLRVVSDSTQHDIGEFVFFKSPTIDALWSGYLVTAMLPDGQGGTNAFPGLIYFDANRVYMQEDSDSNHSFPDQFEGLWTVTVDKRNKQEWTVFKMSANNYLAQKETLTITKE
ncbi:MAG TPA: hypothetical protein VL651_13890 [Bacteroidia bacterium]|nr:hypothetical protein [Bacteroidia bacterium]